MPDATVRVIDLIKISLRLESPLSVAAPEIAPIKGVDLPVAKDPLTSKPYMPATGIVGSLRAHAGEFGLSDSDVVGLFGGRPVDDSAGAKGDKLIPSLVRALGTRLGDGEPQLRTQTAIDRKRASAIDGSLRTRESIPAAAGLEVYLSISGASDAQLALLKQVLAGWQPYLGGGLSVGYGRASLQSVRRKRLDLDTSDGLAFWLGLGGPATWKSDAWETWDIKPGGANRPSITIAFDTAGDVMVSSGSRERSEGRTVGDVMRDGDRPYVPGSAFKGVFRSRAEFVLRSMGLPACEGALAPSRPDLDPGEAQPPQTDCSSTPCLACRLFGRAGSGGRRSSLYFGDSHFAPAKGQSAVKVAERTHVALDRFTGGASHGLLFTQNVVESGRLEVGVTVAPGVDVELARALLEVVAVDIHEGFVGVGHGTDRGMGSLRLSDSDAKAFRERWSANLERIRAEAGVETA